jgi:hypothetical protein
MPGYKTVEVRLGVLCCFVSTPISLASNTGKRFALHIIFQPLTFLVLLFKASPISITFTRIVRALTISYGPNSTRFSLYRIHLVFFIASLLYPVESEFFPLQGHTQASLNCSVDIQFFVALPPLPLLSRMVSVCLNTIP